ncbi:hypothetical protein BDW66DRAFT_3253 [Aspergillus desertorum]
MGVLWGEGGGGEVGWKIESLGFILLDLYIYILGYLVAGYGRILHSISSFGSSVINARRLHSNPHCWKLQLFKS